MKTTNQTLIAFAILGSVIIAPVKMWYIKSLLILLFSILFFSSVMDGQLAFTNYDELRVSDSTTNEGKISLALKPDGSCWIVWGTASQFLYPDLNFDGVNSKAFLGIYQPFAFSNSSWGFINTRYTVTDFQYPGNHGWYRHTTDAFYYLFSYNKTQIDTVAHLFDLRLQFHDTVPPERDINSTLNDLTGINGPDKLVICTNIKDNYNYLGLTKQRIFLYDFHNKTTTDLFTNQQDECYGCYSKNEYIMSPMYMDRVALLSRLRYAYDGSHYNASYSRNIYTFSPAGDTLSPNLFIDSITYNNIGIGTEKILLGRNDDVYLFRTDSLGWILGLNIFVDVSGIISKERPLLNPVKGTKLSTNYNVANLSQDRILVVWDAIDIIVNKSNVYCGLLDKDMNWIGQPKRINSDINGDHYSPSVALKGDTVYVAWLDTRDGKRHVYMRRFLADQITNVKIENTPPKGFAIQEIYPNPFREMTTIKFSIAQWERISVKVFDFLGREVKTLFDSEAESGLHSVQFDANGLPNGIFQVVLHSGKKVEKKKYGGDAMKKLKLYFQFDVSDLLNLFVHM